MKIPNSKYLRPIQYATEHEIVYEPYKNDLEESWDTLSKYYNKILQIEQSEHLENLKLRNKILSAKVEIEIARKNYDLIKDNILTTTSSNNSKKEVFSLKKSLIQECIKIIENQIKNLQSIFEEEENLYKIIKKYKSYHIKIFNDHLRIFGNKSTFLKIKNNIENNKMVSKGLKCIIKFKDKFFIAQEEPKVIDDPVEKMIEYIKEMELIKKIDKGDISIEITNNFENKHINNNILAEFVLQAIKNNISENKIIEKIFIFMAKKIADEILGEFTTKFYKDRILKIFFVKKNQILRAEILEDDLKLFLNERELEFY